MRPHAVMMNHWKKSGTLALAILALVLLMGAVPCAAAGKDSFTVAFQTQFDTMDQYKNTQRSILNLGYLVWDPLVERDPDNCSIQPHLVTAWNMIDPTTWEFKLRPGVKFHNGNPLTAECVRFTIEDRILNPEQKSPQAGNYKWIKSVQVVDDLTFRIITEKPYPLILERLNVLFVYDPVYTKEKGDRYVSEFPMGTGPYKFVRWDKGSKVVLTANENYWKSGVPKIKQLTIRTIPEMSTRIAELISGGIDSAEYLVPDQVPLLEKQPNIKIMDTPTLRTNFWQFDASGRASKTPLTDVRVRRAICHAIDRETIINTVLKGYGKSMNSAVNPFQFGYDPSLKAYEYNPEMAKALLKEAGYPDGFEIDLWEGESEQDAYNQAAMGYLAKVGIKVNLKDYRANLGQLITMRNSGKVTGIGNYAWGNYNIFDADAILAAWFLSADPKCYDPDPELEAWLTEARVSVDQEKRKELYFKAQQRIKEQAYWMPICAFHNIHGVNKNLIYKIGIDDVPRFQYAEWAK